MADETNIVDENQLNLLRTYKNLLEGIATRKKQLADLKVGTEDHRKLAEEIARFENKSSSAYAQMNMFTKSLAAGVKTAVDGTGAFATFKSTLEGISEAGGETGRTISTTLRGAFGSLISKTGELAEAMAFTGNAFLQDFSNPVTETGSSIERLGTKMRMFNDALRNIVRTQNTLRQAFVVAGESITANRQAIEEYPQTLRRASMATALSTKELHEMTKVAGSYMPDAFKETRVGIEMFGDAAIKSARPADMMATAMRRFGLSSQEASQYLKDVSVQFVRGSWTETAEQIGLVAGAVDATGVNAKVAFDAITKTSSNLAIFGQRSASAAQIWTTFTQSLKDTVPIEEVNKIINQVTQGIANMSVQNRAFITMMGGMLQGASALGGALRMELEMRSPGGLEKNLDALTNSLARFGGGQVITLEQAANNPQLEMQFQLQRQMLGQLTGITSAEQQNRVLETLQNVQKGGMSTVEGQAALKDAFAAGKDIQERQLTALERIEQIMRAAWGGRIERRLGAVNEAMRLDPRTTGALMNQEPYQEGASEALGNVVSELRNKLTGDAVTAWRTTAAKEREDTRGTMRQIGRIKRAEDTGKRPQQPEPERRDVARATPDQTSMRLSEQIAREQRNRDRERVPQQPAHRATPLEENRRPGMRDEEYMRLFNDIFSTRRDVATPTAAGGAELKTPTLRTIAAEAEEAGAAPRATVTPAGPTEHMITVRIENGSPDSAEKFAEHLIGTVNKSALGYA